jgi:hypothetical protein
VIPVLEPGTPAAIGYAEASGIPYGQGLVKNSYVGRTFIQRQTIRQLGIGVNKGNPHARRRFTLCHELKHVLDADRDKITYKDLTPEQRESIADWFAACYLMPKPWLRRAWTRGIQDPDRSPACSTSVKRQWRSGCATSASLTTSRTARLPATSGAARTSWTWRRKEFPVGRVITLQPRTEPSDRPLRAVLYLRVSTAEQAATDYDEDGYSLHAQRDACRRAAERLNADVVDDYVDRGKSARSADRPKLQLMLRRIREECDVDYVIVRKVDRLARSRADDVQIVLSLRQAGATLVSATENIDETPSGTLLHAIMAAVAEFTPATWRSKPRKA